MVLGSDVTLSVIDKPLKLVRVPRSRLNESMWAVTKALWFRERDDPFISLTVNALELSIFADSGLIETAFRPLTASTSTAGDGETVIISDDCWLALQIEQHSDDFEQSGARVKEISAPLAREGISIMFLGTRNSDFLLCKEHRLDHVLAILQQNGFHLVSDPDDCGSWTSAAHSAAQSPVAKRSHSPARSSSVTGSLILTRSVTFSSSTSPARQASFDALTNSTDSLREERGRGRTMQRMREVLPADDDDLLHDLLKQTQHDHSASEIEPAAVNGFTVTPAKEDDDDLDAGTGLPRSFPSPSFPLENGFSTELLASSLAILSDELVCVGLALEHENVWREKLLRALFFCDEILSVEDDDPFSMTDELAEGEEGLVPVRSPKSSSGSTKSHALLSVSTHSLTSTAAASTPRPNTPASQQRLPSRNRPECHPDELVSTRRAARPTPFLGFTQTSDSASLTADVRLLRSLFSPKEENEMVYAAGDGGLSAPWVDEEVSKLSNGVHDPARDRQTHPNGDEAAVDGERRLLKCLQLDLSQFGLDRFGIVNRFADLLTNEGINLLYASTFRTANILVSKTDLTKARAVLQAHSASA